MSAQSSKAKMQLAMKDFEVKWRQLSEAWDDPASRALTKRFIEPLHARIRQTMSALDKVGEVQVRAKRECSSEFTL